MRADDVARMSVSTPRACVNKGPAARMRREDGLRGNDLQPRSEHDSRRPPPRQVRYLSGFFDFQTLGRQLHREALEVGWTAAEQQIAISDGGVGLEDFFQRFFPKAECIFDFYHAKEYLVELAKAIYLATKRRGRIGRTRCVIDSSTRAARRCVPAGDTGREIGFGGGSGGPSLHGAILPQPRTPDGLPTLRSQRLADRFRPGGVGLQDRGGQSAQRRRNALGRGGSRRRLPPPRPLPQRTRLLGLLLESAPQLTPPQTDAHTVYTPAVTVWVFLSQCLSPDHSCRDAVARLIAWRLAAGLSPCSADTGAYCTARSDLPEEALARIGARDRQAGRGRIAARLGFGTGRKVRVVDGSTITMPDTPENQAAYPQQKTQKPGCGFPIARILVIFLALGGHGVGGGDRKIQGQADRRKQLVSPALRCAWPKAT